MLASADLVLGRLRRDRGDSAKAEEAWEDAYFGAQRAGELELAASASFDLIVLVGPTLSRHADAIR